MDQYIHIHLHNIQTLGVIFLPIYIFGEIRKKSGIRNNLHLMLVIHRSEPACPRGSSGSSEGECFGIAD